METVLLPRELTAENGAKHLLNGEFFEEHEVSNPEYCGCGNCSFCRDFPDVEEMLTEKTTVSWTTIKDIYRMIVSSMEISGETDHGLLRIKYDLTIDEYHKLKSDFEDFYKWTKGIKESFRNRKWNHGSYKVEKPCEKEESKK